MKKENLIINRNFHYINKNNPVWFKKILLDEKIFFFIIKVLRLLSFLKFFKKIEKKFTLKKFFFNHYFSNDLHEKFYLDIGLNTRQCHVLKPDESFSFKKEIKGEEHINIGFNFLENLSIYTKNYNLLDAYIEIKIFCQNVLKKKYFFCYPVDTKKHAVSINKIGNSWFDIKIDLSDFKNQVVNFNIIVNFKKKSLVFRESNQIKNFSDDKIFLNEKCIALSAPFYSRKSHQKKILLLICESLTDPFYLQNFYKKNIGLNNLDALIESDAVYTSAYSVADSTLPNIPSILSGLLPSQHKIGDYQLPINQSILNKNIKTLPNLLKEEFLSSFLTCYPRFDRLYGWGNDVHNFYNSDGPWKEYSPDAKKIIDTFEFYKNTNTFIYCHMDFLHLPNLHHIKKNYLKSINIDSLNDAAKYNFLNLYFDALQNLDLEIGIILSYLKTSNQYDNTKIIISGDHGIAMPPKWMGNGFDGVEFAHYNEHSKVPLITKNAVWENNKEKLYPNPITSQTHIFKNIIDTLNLKIPSYLVDLPQFDNLEYAISETTYHPKKENYSIVLNSKEYKYWKMLDIDWKKNKIIKEIKSKLFDSKENDITNLDHNLMSKLNNISNKIVERNLSFKLPK
jgi:hypothetical protein